MEIGDRTKVTLGNRQVDVTVTDANIDMLKDGDLTNDLGKIKAKDGDKNAASAADFEAAGFSPADRNVLAAMSKAVKDVDLSEANLAEAAGPFKAVVASKPYLMTADKTPTLADLQGRLATMPVDGRNGILSELATETAMLQHRGKVLQGIGKGMQAVIDEYMTGAKSFGAMMAGMGGDTPAAREAVKKAVLAHPDLPLVGKHALLQDLGMTAIDERNKAITAARQEALAHVHTQASALYAKLGGLGTMGETHSMATGDGTGTFGLAGLKNLAIAWMSYGDGTALGQRGVDGLHKNAMTYTPTDLTKPVALHLGASGADQTGNQLYVSRGGQSVHFTIRYTEPAGKSPSADDRPKTLTTLELDETKPLPAGVRWDKASQTLTFPPGKDPITVNQESAFMLRQDNSKNYDEIQVNVTVFNASTGVPSLAIDFGKLYAADDFTIHFDHLPKDQQKQLKEYAKYLSADPGRTLTLDLAGKGPTNFDGAPMAEIDGYGPEGSGTSKAEFAPLRSAMLDLDAEAGKGTVTATTDPSRSGLTGKLTKAGSAALTAFMAANPGLTLNDALSGLRALAVKDLIGQLVVAAGGKAGQVKVGMATVDASTGFSEAQARKIADTTPLVTNLAK